MPRFLRSTFFCHLAELLSVEDPTWEMIAMVFFTEVSLMGHVSKLHMTPSSLTPSAVGYEGSVKSLPSQSGLGLVRDVLALS